MNLVHSRDNPRYKHWVKVAASKVTGEVMLEGIHLCQEWLRHQGSPRHAVFDVSKLEKSPELQALFAQLPVMTCTGLDSVLWSKLSSVAGEGQGVFFVVVPPDPKLPARITDNCLWLDRIQDPGNMGTLLRTAAAVGIRDIYISEGSARAWTSKVLRSAQGAHFVLQIHENADLVALLYRLDLPLAVTTLEGGLRLFDAQLPDACAWVAGNEGQGVARALQERANLRVFIPQAPVVESLNVAVATAVCLYEQWRQNRQV